MLILWVKVNRVCSLLLWWRSVSLSVLFGLVAEQHYCSCVFGVIYDLVYRNVLSLFSSAHIRKSKWFAVRAECVNYRECCFSTFVECDVTVMRWSVHTTEKRKCAVRRAKREIYVRKSPYCSNGAFNNNNHHRLRHIIVNVQLGIEHPIWAEANW